MTACEYKVYLVCMWTDINNDLIIIRQQYADCARSEQSYLTSSGTFMKTVFVQPEYNCIIFSCSFLSNRLLLYAAGDVSRGDFILLKAIAEMSTRSEIWHFQPPVL